MVMRFLFSLMIVFSITFHAVTGYAAARPEFVSSNALGENGGYALAFKASKP